MSNIGATPSGFPPANFISQSIVTTGQTLQQAIDAAPPSNTLVRQTTTGITSFGGGVYGVPATAKPNAFFLDAMLAHETPDAFIGSTLNDPEGIYTDNAYLWTYDATNSRIICYNKGNPVSEATCADYHAVIAANTLTYDSIILRPGIYVIGLGTGSSEIKALTGRKIPMHLGGAFGDYAFTVIAASYSGIVGFDIIRNNAQFSGVSGFFGLGFATEITADCFIARDCNIYTDSNADPTTGYYNVGIFFASQSSRSTRAKNVQFINCNVRSLGGMLLMETYSRGFNGLVTFRDCSISGEIFIDGNKNTFILVNTDYTNFNSYNGGRVKQRIPNLDFAIDFGSISPFDGYEYDYIAINSPHYIQKIDDTSISSMYAFHTAYSDLVPKLLINSPVFSEKLFSRGASPVSAAQGRMLASRNSPMPPFEITSTSGAGYSLVSISPLVPKSFTQQAYTTQGTTAKQFGTLNILYKELAARGGAQLLIRGRFAANANTKTLKARSGVSTTLAGITLADISGASWSGTFNGAAFEYRAQVTLSGTTVLISGQMTSSAISSPLRYIAEQTISDGQYLQLVLDAAGVATGDITVIYQSIEVDG